MAQDPVFTKVCLSVTESASWGWLSHSALCLFSGCCWGRPSCPPHLTGCERSTHPFLGLSSGKVLKPLALVWLTKCYQFILKFTLASPSGPIKHGGTFCHLFSGVRTVACSCWYWASRGGRGESQRVWFSPCDRHLLSSYFTRELGVGGQAQLESQGSSNLESCCLTDTPPPMASKENNNQPSNLFKGCPQWKKILIRLIKHRF